MRKTLRFSTAAVLVAGLAGVTALAQPPGGGGFGGFGFGGGGTGPAQLVRSKTVKAELKVTDEQASKLDEWAKEFQGKMFEMMKDSGISKDTPREEMGKKMAEMNAKVTDEAYKQIGTVLKEEQVKRLRQIDVQVAGPNAFTRKDVQDALKPTDEQKAKFREINAAAQKERQELRQEYGIGGRPGGGGGKGPDQAKMAEYNKKSAALDAETMTKISALLTDDQKKEWTGLIGEKVDVAKIQEETRFGGFQRKKDN
jgi:Spy/CpxP family protein refolding chaperone